LKLQSILQNEVPAVKTNTPTKRITRSQSGLSSTGRESNGTHTDTTISKNVTSKNISIKTKQKDSDTKESDCANSNSKSITRKKQKNNISQEQTQDSITVMSSKQNDNTGVHSEKQEEDYLRELRGTIEILNLLRMFGEAFRLLCQYSFLFSLSIRF
jgi:intergrase/recombinase